MKHTLTLSAFVLAFAGFSFAQTPTPSPSPEKGQTITGNNEEVVDSGNRLDNGVFTSKEGRFSIAISDWPTNTIDVASELKDTEKFNSKQYQWIINRKVFTVQWAFPIPNAKEPEPLLFSDMEIAIRKAVLNTGGTMLSEKPITYGSHRGTEFRSVSNDGVKFIYRTFKIGDSGYQLIGSHHNRFDEKATEDILDSFKVLEK